MALTPECWGYDCKIVQCLRNKDLQFCYQCSEYENKTCEKFEKLAQPYLEEDGVDVRANLERIRKGEVEEWLRESEEKYRCPVCGKPLSTGAMQRKCYHCEADFSTTP
jgi:rubrerythrin